VTLFGESAGAISLCIHLITPGSNGLFNGTILESGFCNDMSTLNQSENIGRNFSLQLGCDPNDLSCARSKSAEDVLKVAASARWWPTIDNVVMSDQPINILKTGNFNTVSGVILGTNLNEWSLFVCGQYANMTANEFKRNVISSYGTAIGQELLKIYDVNKYDHPVQALIDLGSDLIFKCPTRQAIRAISNTSTPSFLYSFEHKPNFSVGNCLNVAHSYEIPFVFPGIFNTTLTNEEKVLSNSMITYWTQFANSVSNPQLGWPNYTFTDDTNLVLDLKLDTRENYRKLQCDFWDSISN